MSADRRTRPYRTRWSVVVFVVLAVLVCLGILVWQLRDGPPDQADGSPVGALSSLSR